MERHQTLVSLVILALCGTVSAGPADKTPTSSAGPIFTIPRTVVVLDMQVDKSVNSPGQFCEFADLFFPGMDLTVACNSNILPPLKAQVPGQPKPTDVDKDLMNKSDDELSKGLKDGRKAAKAAQSAAKAASNAFDKIAAEPSWEKDAAAIETPLLQAITEKSAAKAAADKLFTDMSTDDKKAKTAARAAGLKVDQYLAGLKKAAASAATELDKANKALADAQPSIAAKRIPLSETCSDDSVSTKPEGCARLDAAAKNKDTADKMADLAAADAARYDRRPAHASASTKVKSYAVTTRGVPDPDYVQNLPYATGFFKDTSQTFTLEEGGLIQGITSTTTDHTGEVIFGVLKAAAGIAGRIITGAATDVTTLAPATAGPEEQFIEFLVKDGGTKLKSNFLLLPPERRNQYVAGWFWGVAARQQQVRTALTLAKRNYLDMADLEDNYRALLGVGGAGPGAAAAQAENRKLFTTFLTAAWNGSTEVTSWSPTYEVTPAKSSDPVPSKLDPTRPLDGQKVPLFRIAKCGVDSETPILAGVDNLIPVRTQQPKSLACSLDPQDEEPRYEAVNLTVSAVTSPKTVQRAVAEKLKDLPNAGLPFVIPADATAAVSYSGIRLTDPRVLLAQWGTVAFIPASAFGSSGGVEATYYQATGALKSVTQKSSAKITASQVTDLGTAVQGVIDAKLNADAKQAKDAKDATDELLKWKRLGDILTARKTAEDLCKELGINPCQ